MKLKRKLSNELVQEIIASDTGWGYANNHSREGSQCIFRYDSNTQTSEWLGMSEKGTNRYKEPNCFVSIYDSFKDGSFCNDRGFLSGFYIIQKHETEKTSKQRL